MATVDLDTLAREAHLIRSGLGLEPDADVTAWMRTQPDREVRELGCYLRSIERRLDRHRDRQARHDTTATLPADRLAALIRHEPGATPTPEPEPEPRLYGGADPHPPEEPSPGQLADLIRRQ